MKFGSYPGGRTGTVCSHPPDPTAVRALGVPHARAALDRRGRHEVRVGFSVAEPAEWLGGDDAFWAYLSDLPRRDFAAHVDYVGLGLYPDAFSPVAPRGEPGGRRVPHRARPRPPAPPSPTPTGPSSPSPATATPSTARSVAR